MANMTQHAGLGPMTSVSGHGLLAVLNNAFSALGHMLAVRRQRRDLIDLDDRLLSDIGLDRAEAVAEYRKSTWM